MLESEYYIDYFNWREKPTQRQTIICATECIGGVKEYTREELCNETEVDLKNCLINGDCIEIMKLLPNDSIAGCITDPPYNYEFIGKTWDRTEIDRRKERVKTGSSTLVKNIPYGSGLAGGVRNARWYQRNRDNILEYQQWCENWGEELFRITKPGSLVLVFNSTRTIAHVQVSLENCGFYARDIIVWRRSSGIPKGLNVAKKMQKIGETNPEIWDGWHSCLRNEWEAICVLQKPLADNYINTLHQYGTGLFNTKTDGGFQSNIIEDIKRDDLDEFNIHCTVKPLELIEKLVTLTMPKLESNILIDPFLGSGTTAVACKKLGVNFCGIEIDDEYMEIAKKRLQLLR